MRPELIVLVVCAALSVVVDYACLVVASEADKRADEMAKRWEEEKKKNEHKD